MKYLSNNNGLAPEEQEPAFWEVDHSLPGHQFDYVPEALGKTCNYCHTIGRVLLQRRTRDDYEKLFRSPCRIVSRRGEPVSPAAHRGERRFQWQPIVTRLHGQRSLQIAPQPVDEKQPLSY